MRHYHSRFIGVLALMLLFPLSGNNWADSAGEAVFAAGKVFLEHQQQRNNIAQGNAIPEGAQLITGADGYLYIKTRDDGFLILRPNSRARIVTYQYDPEDPHKTKIKIELDRGVARSISGKGARQSKQQFRFNTPIAAIGIRGTDFTVYTTQTLTRVSIQSGGIVMSGFDSDCLQSGFGPCEGAYASELFADQKNHLLQLNSGDKKSELLEVDSLNPAPYQVAPPGPNEPQSQSEQSNLSDNSPFKPEIEYAALLKSVTVPEAPASPRLITWGRWRSIADLPASTSTEESFAKERELIGLNSRMALTKEGTNRLVMPNQGNASFKLADHEGYFHDETGNRVISAQASNGKLDVDFNQRSFATSLDLSADKYQTQIRAVGSVQSDGRLQGDPLRSNAAVNGIITGQSQPDQAGYLYQRRVDSGLSAIGATYWKR